MQSRPKDVLKIDHSTTLAHAHNFHQTQSAIDSRCGAGTQQEAARDFGTRPPKLGRCIMHLGIPVDLFIAIQLAKNLCILVACVLDVRNPQIGESRSFARHGQGASHGSTVVVATDNDMLDLEDSDSVLQARHAVEVLVRCQVANIAVHENLSRGQSKNLVGLQLYRQEWRLSLRETHAEHAKDANLKANDEKRELN